MAKSKREYDLILWGATGFTGRLVAEHIAASPDAGALRWALGGRTREKLERVRSEIAAEGGDVAGVDIVVGDAGDAASMKSVAARTRVVATTVGPFARYGSELVAACAEQGTDYCDITGETQWIRRMIDAHHEQALASGARIVHCCGFDSIPSDLGTQMVQEHAVAEHGVPCDSVSYYVMRMKGGASGGTVHSILNIVDEVKRDPSIRRVLGNPYALNPDGMRKGPDRGDQNGVKFDSGVGGYTGPFVMAAINTRIVRRSHALLGSPWGADFRYREVTSFGPGPAGFAKAAATSAGIAGFMVAAATPGIRGLLERFVLPKPGTGPSREDRENGGFVVRLVGEGSGDNGPFSVEGTVVGHRDPGYGETATMMGQAALCLALDGDNLSGGGVRTPASTMGSTLTERLRRAGMEFNVRTL